MKAMGVQAAVIVLTTGADRRNLLAEKQMKMAKEAGMAVHCAHIAQFMSPEQARDEAKTFMTMSRALGFSSAAIHSLIFAPTFADKTANTLINFFQETLYIEGYRKQDLCVPAELLANNIVEPRDLQLKANLTVIDYDRLAPSVAGVGTWIFTDEYLDERQTIAYDFLDYYTRPNQIRGRQLSLEPEYIARPGDNYPLIAHQLGMRLIDLLLLNHAGPHDKVVPGQRIRVA